MYMMDYHIHSNNSFDGKDSVTSICEAAIMKGLNEICFTDHFSLKEGLKTYGTLNMKKYSDEISTCKEIFKNNLIIKAGLEICEPHETESELRDTISNIPFDFILGSIHNFDHTGLSTYMRAHEKETSYEDYFKEVNKISTSPFIDVVAHIDLMKRYAFVKHGKYEFNTHKEIIEEILKNIISRGKGIEVNTSTLRSEINETMPSIDALKMYKELGGEIITVGSDAHCTTDVGEGIREALDLLKSFGFENIYTFEERKAIAHKVK